MRRYAQIKKQLGALGRPADAPGLSTPDAAEVSNSFVSSICGFLFPSLYPFHYYPHHFVEAADGVALRTSNGERGVDIHARNRNAHPKRAVVFENNLHVGGFTQDADVGQHSVIDKVMRAHTIAAVL